MRVAEKKCINSTAVQRRKTGAEVAQTCYFLPECHEASNHAGFGGNQLESQLVTF